MTTIELMLEVLKNMRKQLVNCGFTADDLYQCDEAIAAGEQELKRAPDGALMRSRYVTTLAKDAVDQQDHFSDWGIWMPTTHAHAKAVTDVSRDSPKLYEMKPLYLREETK